MTPAIGTAGLLVLLVVPSGWLLARALGGGRDLFAVVFCGLAACSLVAVVLAVGGAFTVPALVAGLAVVAGGALLVARGRAAASTPPSAPRPVRMTALAAGLVAAVWCWPPFETFLGGADSTMYLNAGVHLARYGALAVPDTVLPALGEEGSRAALQRLRGRPGLGPYVRLPGGLLVDEPTHGPAFPAFFPLLPAWTGLASILAPTLAPAVAPAFAGLAVWAVALFAGEAFGAVAAAVAGALFGGHFVLWWFGRFAMPETLACAFLFGGLVFLRRGEPFAAGVLLGCAGLARTETALFAAAAGALWLAWVRVRPPAPALLCGFVPPAAVAAIVTVLLPSHHYAYLRNDLGLIILRVWPRLGPWWEPGYALVALAAGVALAAVVGAAGRRAGVGFVRTIGRVAAVAVVGGGVVAYVVLGGNTSAARNLAWLATYGGWPVLVLGTAGMAVVWRYGGPSGRLLALLWCLVVVVFGANPRVAPWHPWAMRRFLPIVIPGLAIGTAAALAPLARRGPLGAAATLVLAAVLAWHEMRPVRAVRSTPYYAGTWQAAADVAALVPPDAVVVVDPQFADFQLQVPLWLAHGRETLMLPPGHRVWTEVVGALLAHGRRVYWVTNRYGTPQAAAPFTAMPLAAEPEVRISVPAAPADGPPARTTTVVAALRVYSIAAGDAAGVGDAMMTPAPP